jgi:UDP-N-acetylglucosamine:LPS N-acetylglucosamine transferase
LNAEIFVRSGAARLQAEKGATGESVARLLLSLLESPQTLATMSASAKALAPRDAAARVAAVLTEAQA